MRSSEAALRRPLDRVFASRSHVAVLRALLDSAEGMSGRQVARLAGVNHQTCAVALGRLEEAGVVRRQGSGQSQLFRLNRDHTAVRDLLVPLLRREREAFPRLLHRLGRVLSGRCARAIIFGSVARSEEAAGSDLHLLVITEDASQEQTARAAIHRARSLLLKEWGVQLNPIVLTRREIAAHRRIKDPLILDILREGVDVPGGHRGEHARAEARTPATG